MKTQINEVKRMQLLAGIINESQLNEENPPKKLSPEEQKIVDDLLNTLTEGNFSNVLSKLKDYLKKGAITTTILTSLLAAPNLVPAQKQQIQKLPGVAQIMQQKGGGIDNMINKDAYNYVLNLVNKNPDNILKQLNQYKPLNQEEKNDLNMLITFVNSVKEKKPISNPEYMGKRFKFANKIINTLQSNSPSTVKITPINKG